MKTKRWKIDGVNEVVINFDDEGMDTIWMIGYFDHCREFLEKHFDSVVEVMPEIDDEINIMQDSIELTPDSNGELITVMEISDTEVIDEYQNIEGITKICKCEVTFKVEVFEE
jgi:hypothetical protein